MCLRPQRRGDGEGIEADVPPPLGFVAAAMNLAVMSAAQWHREFVAHLAAERRVLGKPDVVSVDWLSSADEARLRRDEFDVGFVT